MNERKILAYHHQFDSMRIDGLQRLYETVDHLRYQVRGCTTGFIYDEYPGTLVDFFVEETRRFRRVRRRIQLPERRPRFIDAMFARGCMTIDLGDGWIRRLGFPIYRHELLWFPELRMMEVGTDFYRHIRALKRETVG